MELIELRIELSIRFATEASLRWKPYIGSPSIRQFTILQFTIIFSYLISSSLPYFDSSALYRLEQETRFNFCELKFLDCVPNSIPI